MKNLKGMKELNANEMQDTKGGIFPYILAAGIIWGYYSEASRHEAPPPPSTSEYTMEDYPA